MRRTAILSLEKKFFKAHFQISHGIVIRSRLTIDARLLAALPSLKWIARSGSGLDNIDVEEAEARGVQIVINSPEGNRDAVGEHARNGLSFLCCFTS